MKNFTQELKDILKEDPGAPILSPDEVRSRANTMVILTNEAPRELLALAGPTRKAILLNYKPLMITFPDQRGVYKVQPDDIVFENHHSGRDVTEAGSQETSYEKFFASAMKKFGVSSPIELSPDETKKFFNYVDKNWEAEEESDGSKTEILPAIGAAVGGVARAAGAGLGAGLASAVTGDDNEDVSTGKVGKKDKGSYKKAYKLALKKYKIHSADELDTPAERKGFTDYVDRLWKGGEVHESGCPCPSCVVNEVSPQVKARRKELEKKEREKRAKEAPQQSDDDKKRDADRKQKLRDKKLKKIKQDRAAADYRKDLDKKLAQKKREKEQQRKARDDKQQKQDDKDDKKPSGGFGSALSKVTGSAKGALSKYKSSGK